MNKRDKMLELALIKTRIVAMTGIKYDHPVCLEIDRLRDLISMAVDAAEDDVVGVYNRRVAQIEQDYIEIRMLGSEDVQLVPRYSQKELDDHAYAQEMQDASDNDWRHNNLIARIRAQRAKYKPVE